MFSMRVYKIAAIVALVFGLLSSSLMSRALYDKNDGKFPGYQRAGDPLHASANHRVGNIALCVNNNGTLGNNYSRVSYDFFTNQTIPFACEVPKNGGVEYLYGASFWIGAVVGRDTLVSVGHDGWQSITEFFPDPDPTGRPKKKSIIDPTVDSLYEGAISEEDFIFQYTDTVTNTGSVYSSYDPFGHKPIGIEVNQRSFAWSYAYAEDFVLFDYSIRNIGVRSLKNVYMGVYVDADVGADEMTAYLDDLCGFIPSFLDTHLTCTFIDEANIAWIADNDGDMSGIGQPARHVTGTRIVRTPAESLEVSFNWWIGNGTSSLDFGPREKPLVGKWKEDYRDYGTGGLGTPEGDKNKYYVLRNQEFDYDQAFTCVISPLDSIWLLPNQALACDFGDGYDTRYLLSFGPFNIDPGEVLPLSFAYVAGLNIHVDPDNASNNLPLNPKRYYEGLRFKDLQVNARWASWIYDNPGVDTDSDGYAGEIRLCPLDSALDSIDSSDVPWDSFYTYTAVDTTYGTGDGVPDFRGASPPPAPNIFLEPSVGSIHVRFNGYRSETTRDPFSRSFDFEGYRIYLARDNRSSSFSRLVSYDRENYNKWTFNQNAVPPTFQLIDEPFSFDELVALYGFGDPNFDPLKYTINRPYRHPIYPDSQFYFEKQGFNVSSLTDPDGIRKVYPSQPYPSTLVLDSLPDVEKTDEGYPKYFEYEYDIPELLPTVPYWISVTAFDFGSPSSGLPSLETNVTSNTGNAYPLDTWQSVEAENLKVFVYPNPYRGDGDYRNRGYEGVDTTGRRLTVTQRPDDRVRTIHFANLPPKCTISIFSLDGDLVREINHDMNPIDPNATHDSWDMITRNTQSVVSGLYYWTVENSETGEVQIGKLAIIM